ncbi:MAG TPA: hypothetical protein VI968_03315 [archaeon]|nr:hypothetical protein [archaeon]
MAKDYKKEFIDMFEAGGFVLREGVDLLKIWNLAADPKTYVRDLGEVGAAGIKFLKEVQDVAGVLGLIGLLFAGGVQGKHAVLPAYSQVEVQQATVGTEPHNWRPWRPYHRNPFQSESIPYLDITGNPIEGEKTTGKSRFYFNSIGEASGMAEKLSPVGASTTVAELPGSVYGKDIKTRLLALGDYRDVVVRCTGDESGYDKSCALTFTFVDANGGKDRYVVRDGAEVKDLSGVLTERECKTDKNCGFKNPRPPHDKDALYSFMYPR